MQNLKNWKAIKIAVWIIRSAEAGLDEKDSVVSEKPKGQNPTGTLCWATGIQAPTIELASGTLPCNSAYQTPFLTPLVAGHQAFRQPHAPRTQPAALST